MSLSRRMLQVCAVDFTAFHFLRPLLHAARAQGWDVQFACADGPWAAALRSEGFRHWDLPIVRTVSPIAHARAIALLAARLWREPVDLIHTHTPIGGLIGRSAAIATPRIPVVHTFHGLPFRANEGGAMRSVFFAYERVLASRTRHFFSQAAGDAQLAARLNIADPRRLTVIGNGVDLERFRPAEADRSRVRQSLDVGRAEIVVTTVGRLVREKGLLELADAMMRLRSTIGVHVLVIGDALPSDRTSVAAELDNHPVTRAANVRWRRLGHREDVHLLLRASDLFVLPTHREGLPRSVIEALATGVPVVTTDIPACQELVDEAVGRLVPVNDPTALAAAMSDLIDDPFERRRLGRQARARALERHDEREIVANQLTVLRSLVP